MANLGPHIFDPKVIIFDRMRRAERVDIARVNA
jgi:hypothetical protein